MAITLQVNERFQVTPMAINQKLFEIKRKGKMQEKTRKLIIEAFAEMNKNPEKYGRNFQTMVPSKTWKEKQVVQLKEIACKLGDHNADWVEQALEWAQKIFNGVSWEEICVEIDKSAWYRLVVWKSGKARIVGGSAAKNRYSTMSDDGEFDYPDNAVLYYTVPLVVIYEE